MKALTADRDAHNWCSFRAACGSIRRLAVRSRARSACESRVRGVPGRR